VQVTESVYLPVENDPSIARWRWTTSIQIANSFVLRGWSELYDGDGGDVAATGDVISLVEAGNLSGVVEHCVNLLIGQVVKDALRLTVE